jgi:hypothetical protein
MTDTVYRFLPWSRRGLSAAIPASPDAAPVPDRARVDIQVVVGGAGPVPTSTTLNGPGDVIGLDPTVIVRTIPRAGSTNVETNYLAAVDFDQPELPWLFTPSGVPPSGHLRPWLVLVVVRDRPGVSLTVPAGVPLPQLTIADHAADELPDLADSWAWAHVQLLDEDSGSSPATVGNALVDHPDRNVSRLVCPRRLDSGTRWIACVVPAFDAGVVRGFGGTPPAGDLEPAWPSPAPDSVTLPVYFHWQFQTGAEGDFESLARRLKPYEASARIGRVRMHVGAASPFLDLPPDAPDRFLDMDGALQAPAVARSTAAPPVPEPSLAEVPARLVTGLQDVSRILADAADGKLDGQAPGDDDALGPPVYDGVHARRTTVTDSDATWFREINTDPRCRVAAGLGSEVMRKFQEDIMEAAWQQVGDVLAVEAALSRARLSLEAAVRFRDRHLVPLTAGRFLQVTAPLADHTLLAGRTLPRAIDPTSFPGRTTDAAMRRYTAATGRVLSGVARRAGSDAARRAARRAGDRLVTSLAAGRADVDATRFPVLAIDGLTGSMPAADPEGRVSLERYGVAVTLDKASASALSSASRTLVTAPEVPADELVRLRGDLRETGILTEAHLRTAREAAVEQLATREGSLEDGAQLQLSDVLTASVPHVLDAVLTTAAERPADAGFLIETGPSMRFHPLGLQSGGRLVALSRPGVANVHLATLDPRLTTDARHVGDVVGSLPSGAFAPVVVRRGGAAAPRPEVELTPGAAAGGVIVRTPAGGGAAGPVGSAADASAATTLTMPPLVKDAATIARYEAAIGDLVLHSALAVEPVVPQLVAFALAGAVAATTARLDPLVVHPARLDTMVSVAGHGLAAILADPSLVAAWRLPRLFDRVMAYPQLNLPAYSSLAAYDRTRFCPGVDEVPPESITLLETNPRFVAGFLGGLNHETNKELLWRGYPTDGRGTPWRRFWRRTDDAPDIFEIHAWGDHGGHDDLAWQTTDPLGNLVLLLRGDLLRRYPRTMAVAIRAVRVGGVQRPSDSLADLRTPVFAGQFDPDVSFFGFPLVSDDLTRDEGWFFGLLEPVTEPRFGFDETPGRETTNPTSWNDVAWPDLGVEPAGMLRVAQLSSLGLSPPVGQADGVAAALFQRPFKLLVHARHLVRGI